jgi:hypothetical protein
MIPVSVEHALSEEHDDDSRTTVQPTCFIVLQEKQEIPIHMKVLIHAKSRPNMPRKLWRSADRLGDDKVRDLERRRTRRTRRTGGTFHLHKQP